jgi:drug/metabolite transporter (DMT)-like permease
MTPRARPHQAGALLALASAVAFGATTPFVQRLGRGVGPFVTAALLYGGAAAFSVWPRRGTARLRRSDLPRVVAVALLGALAAPVALAWGLQRTNGVAASLLLNLEAVFTVLLARLLWAEPIGGRAAGALSAMTLGGAVLVASGPLSGATDALGSLAVVAATLAWAADNAVGRPLADRDPTQVVLAKAAIGAVISAAIAVASGERLPGSFPAAAVGLAACGAVGYGASLALYLRAQRSIGAGRTGSIFAAAPFVGAAIAWALGQRASGPALAAAGVLFAAGLWLHLTEGHAHEHTHEAVEHSHAHSHDDLHHNHAHDKSPQGEHTHVHRHERATHTHPHALDVDHRHRH